MKVLESDKKSQGEIKWYIQLTYIDLKDLLIKGPQIQKFILEVIPIVQLWVLENKSAININDQRLKKVQNKLKIEQQLLSKIEQQELKEESDDVNKAKAFDFVIESQKSQVKVGKKVGI